MTKMTAEMFGANTPIVPDETLDEWLKETPVKKMTEKERIQKQIEELQTALKLLEIEENRRTPCEKAYRDAYGEFPITDSMSGGDKDYIAWDAFQKGWEAWNEYPKPSMINCFLEGCPPEGYVTWHEWFDEMGSRGILHNLRISSKEHKNQDVLKKLQEKDWNIKVETDYRTGKPRHKTRIVDKDGNDCKPEPLTTEELFRPQPEKRKIDDLSERLLPDDNLYKITDEHGESNPYKQGINMIKEDKETEKLMTSKGYEKNSAGVWEPKNTLWRRFYDEEWSDSACDEFCKIVEKWLYDNTTTVEEDYHTVTIKLKKGMLKSEK